MLNSSGAQRRRTGTPSPDQLCSPLLSLGPPLSHPASPPGRHRRHAARLIAALAFLLVLTASLLVRLHMSFSKPGFPTPPHPSLSPSLSLTNLRAPPSSPPPPLSSLPCVEDAYVRDGANANTNYGSASALMLKRQPTHIGMTREAFLRFESVPLGEKYSVTLTVKETSAKLEPESQVVVCQAGGGWSESNITWSTAPDFAALNSSSCIVSEADLSVGGSVCFDVPADFVDGDGQLNLAVQLVDSGAEWVSFHSRDAPKSHAHPRLHFTEQECRPLYYPTVPFPLLPSNATKTLMVISTCNEVAYTLKLLSTLERSKDVFDVLIVDDASDDGTVDVLRKRGYAVIAKDAATGLTDSWNIGYRWFKEWGYDMLILSNNDILVGDGVVAGMQDMLRHYPFMAPSTTLHGAGHNPPQSLAIQCGLDAGIEAQVNEASNYQRTQNLLGHMCGSGKAYEFPAGRLKFGGFFFGVRAPEVFDLEFSGGDLFDASNPLFGQEDSFIEGMKGLGMQTAVTKSVFVYHYKSVTVQKSGYKVGHLTAENSNLALYHDTKEHLRKWREEEVVVEERSVLGRGAVKVVAIATSHSVKTPLAGDLFTGRGLGDALGSENGWRVVYLDRGADWYNLSGVDVVVAMLDQYDLRQIRNGKVGLVKVAWVRNWFERWGDREWFGMYDLVLSSSELGKGYFERKEYGVECSRRCPGGGKNVSVPVVSVPVEVLRIGTSMLPGKGVSGEESDYVLTMGYHKSEREIMAFDPGNVQFVGALYGAGWDSEGVPEKFRELWRGGKGFSEMAGIYESTKVVVDDANVATKEWGSVNSRVYDGGAVGRLVVSNGRRGIEETFGEGVVPIWEGGNGLGKLLGKVLGDDAGREEMAKRLQDIVLADHTYAKRAAEMMDALGKHGLTDMEEDRGCFDVEKKHQLCVVARTYKQERGRGRGGKKEGTLVDSLIGGLEGTDVEPRVWLVNTDFDENDVFVNELEEMVTQLGIQCNVAVVRNVGWGRRESYGYDLTDWVLESLLDSGGCDYFMFTNGDNYYMPALGEVLDREMKEGRDIVAWDFVTHHERDGSNVIGVKLARRFVDLGSFVVSAAAVRGSGARFMEQGAATNDVFARDWYFIEKIRDWLKEKGREEGGRIGLVHKVLFSHQ